MTNSPSAVRSGFSQWIAFILLGACAFVCSAALMYWITAQGPGVSPDSVTYIEVARNLLAGNGFVIDGKAITHYPPVYPLLIAAVDWLHPGNTIQAARLVAVFFYSTNLVLVGFAVYLCTEYSIAAASCAMLAFLSSAQILSVHSMGWSEAPFVAFWLSSFILFSLHITNPSQRLLVLASSMAGLAAATRYVGVVLFPTIAVAFFLTDKRALKFKLRDVIIFFVVAVLPFICWSLRNILTGSSVTDRNIAFHPIIITHLKYFFITIINFIAPIKFYFILYISYVLMFIIIFILSAIKIIKYAERKIGIIFIKFCLLFSILYALLIFISISFFDAHTPIDERILLPIIISIIILMFIFIWSKNIANNRFVSDRLFFLSIIFIIFNMLPFVATAIDIHKNGTGYTSLYWKNLSIMKNIAPLSVDKVIYSNGNDIIHFLTEQKTVMIPAKISAGTMQLHKDYQIKIGKMIQECNEGKAIIVYFNAIGWRWYLPSVEEIDSSGVLPVLIKNEDGVIYGTRN